MYIHAYTYIHICACKMNNENTINANALTKHAKGRIAQPTTVTGRGNEWKTKRIDQQMQKEHAGSEWEMEQHQREYAYGTGAVTKETKTLLQHTCIHTHKHTGKVWVWVPGSGLDPGRGKRFEITEHGLH